MSLEINTDAIVVSQAYTKEIHKAAETQQDEAASIFDNVNITEESTTNPEPTIPPRKNQTKTEEAEENEEASEETEAEKAKEKKTKDNKETKTNKPDNIIHRNNVKKLFGLGSETLMNEKGTYKGTAGMDFGAGVKYNSKTGFGAEGVYRFSCDDVAGKEGLHADASAYIDYSKEKPRFENYTTSTVGFGLQGNVKYRKECQAGGTYGFVGAGAKVGFQNTDAKWEYADDKEQQYASIITSRPQGIAEIKGVAGGEWEIKNRATKAIHTVSAGASVGLNGYVSAPRSKYLNPQNQTLDVPVESIVPSNSAVNGAFGLFVNYNVATKQGVKVQAGVSSEFEVSNNYTKEYFYRAHQVSDDTTNHQSNVNKRIVPNISAGVTLFFGKGNGKH